MTIYSTSKDIAEIFETIEDANDQKEAISGYMKLNHSLSRFLRWYNSYEIPAEVHSDIVNNMVELNHTVMLVRKLDSLESLKSYQSKDQVVILNRILETIDAKNAMLLENCFDGNLKQYYSNIDWSLFKEFGIEVR